MARASIKPVDPAALPALVPQGQHAGKQSMLLSRPLTVIGSRHRAHLHLLSRSVSKSHAVVGMDDSGVFIRDLASRTHVYVNGKEIRESDLRDGDLVKIGSFSFKYVDKRKSPLLNKPKRATPAAIEVDGSPLPIEFGGRVMLIGRRPTCDISLMEMSVSTCHAVIFEHNGQWIIRDLGSRTGTYVNGELVHQTHLSIGDRVRVGETEMKFIAQGAAVLPDELEDLVGTAPLGEEMLALAGEDITPPPTKGKAPISKKAPATKPPAKKTPPPIPGAPPVPIAPEVEPEPELASPAEHAIANAPATAMGATVVAEPTPEMGDAIKIEPDEPPHLLVDANLYSEAMSGSGTFAGISGEIEQANAEAALDAAGAEPMDLGLDFWHDEPTAVSDRLSAPSEDLMAPALPAEEEPLPLLGAEEPDDSAFHPVAEPQSAAPLPEASAAHETPSLVSQSPLEIAEEPTVLPTPAATIAHAPLIGHPPEPLELGPQLRAKPMAPEPEALVAEALSADATTPIVPGLVVPAAAIQPAPQAPAIAPVEARLAADQAPPASEPVEPPVEAPVGPPAVPPAEPVVEAIDLSAMQFAPPADESAADWETEAPEQPAKMSLLGLDVAADTAAAPPIELTLLRASSDQASESDEALDVDEDSSGEPDPSPAEAAKPKRKRRRKTKAAAEPAPIEQPAESPQPVPAEAEASALGEPASQPQMISELEPLAESASEPTDFYSPEPSLIAPITEAQVDAFVPQAVDSPVEEPPAALELAPMEQSFEPPLDLELANEAEGTIAGEAEPIAINDALEFNFDDSAADVAQASAEEADPKWLGDAQTFEPGAPDAQFVEPASFTSAPVDDELPPLNLEAAPFEAAPVAKAPVPAPAPAEPPAIAKVIAKVDPFRGMQNDLGSFIGGMPLPLPPVAKVPLDDGSSLTFARPPAAPIAPLDVSEPPPELFDAVPEALDALPEALEKIDNVEQAIGEPGTVNRPPQTPPRPLRGGAQLPFGSTPLSPTAPEFPSIIAARNSKSSVKARRGQVTTAFDGLAMQPVRQADVFSQMGTPETDQDVDFGQAQHAPGIDPATFDGDLPPIPTSLTGALPDVPQPTGKRHSRAYLDRKGLAPARPGTGGNGVDPELLNADPSMGDFGGPIVEKAASMPRQSLGVQPGAPTPQFNPMPAQPMRSRPRSRLLRVGLLLPLMLLIAIGLSAAIWFFTPVMYTHRADLTYTNLDKATDWQRAIFLRQEGDTADSAEVLTLAQQIFNKDNSKLSPGFLNGSGTTDQRAQLNNLLKTMVILPGSDQLDLHIDSNDKADAARLNALVHALNVKDKPLVDEAGRLNADLSAARTRLSQLADKISKLNTDLQAEQSAHDRLKPLQDSYADLDAKVADLQIAWQTASRHRNDVESELHYLETSGAGVSASQPAQAAPAADDPETRQLAAQMDRINAELATVRTAHSSSADQANKALEEALKQFGQKVADAQAKLNAGSALSDYLVSAQQVQDAISKQRAEAAEEQKIKQQTLTELKDQLAADQKSQNEALWASDPQLKTWQEDLEIQQHHYEAAKDTSGLQDEAVKIKADMDKLDAQIAARRDQLTAHDPANGDVTKIRKFIDDWLDGMSKEQARNDQRMAEQIQELSAAAPNLSKLPADQKALAEDLEKQQDQLEKARQQYALALESGPQNDEAVKGLETQLADLNAKLSARRREMVEENRKISTAAETAALEQQLKQKDEELTAAQQDENAASLEYFKYKQALADAKSDLDSTTALAARLPEDNAALTTLQNDYNEQTDLVTQATDRVNRAIIPVTLPQIAVQSSLPQDNRWEHMAIAVFFTLVVFCPLIFLAAQSSSPQPSGPLVRPAGLATDTVTTLPPRPILAPAGNSTSRNDPDRTLTSLTAAAADINAEPAKRNGEESPHDPVPAGF